MRTLIPTLAGYFYLLLPIFGSSTSNSMNSKAMLYFVSIGIALSIVVLTLGVISLVWLREIHPRGQGLLDLITKTVSIPHQREQSTPQTEMASDSQRRSAESDQLEWFLP